MNSRRFSLTSRNHRRVLQKFGGSLLTSTVGGTTVPTTEGTNQDLPNQEKNHMAVKTPTKTAAKKAPAKAATKAPAAKKATATKAAATTKPATGAAKKPIDVKDVVKRLKAGETMTSLRSDYGAGTPIRRALLAAGYNTKGEKIEVETISTNGGAKATAKRIANARQENWPWYRIENATGLTETQLRQMLEENGYADLVTGRVPKGDDKPATKAKTPAKGVTKSTAATKPAPKVAPKATKAAGKPAAKGVTKKPGPRRVAKRPQTDA